MLMKLMPPDNLCLTRCLRDIIILFFSVHLVVSACNQILHSLSYHLCLCKNFHNSLDRTLRYVNTMTWSWLCAQVIVDLEVVLTAVQPSRDHSTNPALLLLCVLCGTAGERPGLSLH